MYSLEDLAEHLKTKHNLPVQENQIQDLRNIGYYHGYKGYRFIRKSNNPIKFTAFSQIVDLNNFDMQLKGLFYPNLMFIENALKSYVLEATLADCQSEKLAEIYKKGLTYFKDFKAGSKNYKYEFKKRMDLEMRITNALIRDYMSDKAIETHFYDNDKDIPVWAAFESLTLGEFGTFFACANRNIKLNVSKMLNLPTNLDSDGSLLCDIIFCLKDLRNAIAHNGTIFDTRFAPREIPNRLKKLIEQNMNIPNIDFKYIITYVALTIYIMNKLGETRKCKSFLNEYEKFTKMLKANVPHDAFIQISGSQESSAIEIIKEYLGIKQNQAAE